MPRKFIPKKSDLEIYNEDIQRQLKYALGMVSRSPCRRFKLTLQFSPSCRRSRASSSKYKICRHWTSSSPSHSWSRLPSWRKTEDEHGPLKSRRYTVKNFDSECEIDMVRLGKHRKQMSAGSCEKSKPMIS